MTEFDNIIERNELGYTMARFGSREVIHYQMANDIDYLINLVKVPVKRTPLDLNLLLNDIELVRGVTAAEMRGVSSSPLISMARRVYYFIGAYYLLYSKADLANRMNKSRASVTKSLSLWLNNEYKREEETAIYADVLTKYKNK